MRLLKADFQLPVEHRSLMRTRRVVFIAFVLISLLSTIGMAYFHHYRYDCSVYGDGVVTRDWRGDCYMTTTSFIVVGEPFAGKAKQRTHRSKWVQGRYHGYWMPEGWAP
jgi:hypothetical protein